MPTTNPVPSNDPTDLLFNAQKLDQVVSGSAQYYTDRLGVNRRTVEGISAAADAVLGGLGYAPPVTYAAGILLTLTTQTVEYAGDVYAPKVADLPFTTGGTFETAKFRLIQGVAATDLAASGGAGMIGYMPDGAGTVATTVQSKLRELVSVFDFGAVGNGENETTKLQAALNSGAKKVVIPSGYTFGVTSLTMASGQTLQLDGTLKKLSGTSAVIDLNNQCKIVGSGEIDGNSVASASGINANNKTDVIVDGIYIHHCGGKGINLALTTKYRISKNRVENITQQAINLDFADGGSVSDNYIDTALHGIQFWGGDASMAPGTYTTDISITSNVVKNVTGGIWGSQGQRIVVTGNVVTICSDVGIDFEGCQYCTASSNSVSKCINGGLALFYSSSFCVFDGNSVLIDATTGSRFGVWFTAAANNFNIVSNNTITVVEVSDSAMYFDAGGQFNVVNGNVIFGYAAGSPASIRIFKQLHMTISSNKLVDCKLRLEGSASCHVTGNHIYRQSSVDASTHAQSPLYIYWSDNTWNAKENTVTNNLVQNWQYAIVDDCWGDNDSRNDVSYNRVSSDIYHRGTTSWNGRMLGNVIFTNPNTAATVSSY